MNLTLQIDQVDARKISKTEFRNDYLAKSKPLVIKGFADLFPAGKLWTFDYLNKVMGNHQVGIFDNSKPKSTAITTPDLYMPFSQFSDIIRRYEDTPYRIFLFNMFREFPELRKDFPTPDLVKGPLGNLALSFFGGKNTTVRLHFDIDCSSVLMTQLIGKKRVILIPPEYDDLIYRVPLGSFSLIDLDNPDYTTFEGLKYVKGYDFIMQPGDALFMPNRYWHFNTYLEGGMAVSYRVLAHKPSDIYNGLMNTTVRLAFDKTMNRLLGNSWIEKKKSIAMENANAGIKKMQKEHNVMTF
jgi:hypothetical protein